MDNIINYIPIACYLIFGFFLSYIIRKVYNDLKRERMIKNFSDYMALLNFHLEKAYDMIHKDRVLIYSVEATTLPDEEFNQVTIDFLMLVQKILGPNLVSEFIALYGNYDTFIFNLAEYFNTRYENDEIRKGAIDDMIESETD